MTWALLSVHIGVAAMWLGSMGYSLFVAQPRLARLVGHDPARIEVIQRELAHGNRWRVVGLIATLWATGIWLAVLHPGHWLALCVKATALAGASALFWWVSWRAWPRRVFAIPDELPRLQLRFRRVALVMFALVAIGFLAGLTRITVR